MSEKILFTDMDGTLLTSKKDVSPALAGLISRMIEAGHRFVLSSGRTLPSILSSAQNAGLLYPDTLVIAVNGNLVYDCKTGRALLEKTVPVPVCKGVIGLAHKYGLHIQSYDDSRVVCEKEGPELSFYQKSTGLSAVLTNDIMGHIGHAPYKLLAIDLTGKDRLLALQKEVLSRYGDQVTAIFSCDQYLEFLPEGINKGSGIRFLCDYLQIPLDNTLAAGDAENDITMLETVKLPCVMKNARPEMYPYGKYITEHDNNHSGIAEIIEKFML